MDDTIVHPCFVSVLYSVPLCRCSVQLENTKDVLNVTRTLVTCSLVAHEHFFFSGGEGWGVIPRFNVISGCSSHQ